LPVSLCWYVYVIFKFWFIRFALLFRLHSLRRSHRTPAL
jgi:hypothetical protein